MAVIQIDTRQQPKQHNDDIERYLLDQGYETVHSKVLVGDYIIPAQGSISVDTKEGVSELYSNLITQHDRFKKECQLAKKCDIKLFILTCNDEGIGSVDDIRNWSNPQLPIYQSRVERARATGDWIPKPPATNETLVKIMNSMHEYYGVEFRFCNSAEVGEMVISLLTKVK